MRFFIALQFLTIIPVRIKRTFGERELAQSMFFFPLVGAVIGFVLAGVQSAAILAFPPLVVSVLLVMVLAVLTGGLHIDGLADTADALFSGKDREAKLRIMKASDIGAMGSAAVAMFLMMKVALLGSMEPRIIISVLILMPVAGRCGMLLPALASRYARTSDGTGRAFIGNLSAEVVLPSILITAVIATGLLQLVGLIALAITLVVAVLVGKLIALSVGGMTGDTLGAINEGCEIVFLAATLGLVRTDLIPVLW